MKSKLLLIISTIILLTVPKTNFGQAPTLGAAADYALFSTAGAITNSGTNFLTQVTGNVGSITAASVTGFGNINGQVHEGTDPSNTACNLAVMSAYASLGTAIVDSTLGLVIGNGDTLTAATYLMPGAASLNNDLYLDAQGDPTAVFIFKTPLTFGTSANARIILINGALACNVFWRIDGAVNLGTNTNMRGTIISNGAISLTDGDSLEGRALAINAAVLTHQSIIYTPIGCGSLVLTGPATPNFGTAACFALFTSIGAFVDNFGTFVNNGGDIGNNSGAVSGFDPLKLTGATHSLDGASSNAASDLLSVYNDLNALTTAADIELLQPTLFGHNLVLTPHIYHMASAVTFTDTVYLNAQNNPNAVFIILVNGRFDATPNSRVVLMNGAQARNVYWKIDGAVSIGVNSIFNGTIVAFGQVDLLTGVELNGRALVVDGALNTFSNIINTPPGCGFPPTSTVTQPGDTAVCLGSSASFTVFVTGTSLTYQWRRGNVNLINGGNISGVNTATLTINPVSFADTSSFYNVVIGGNPNDTSIFVSLTIIGAPIITTAPINQTACVGSPVNFSVTASGQSLTYQWRKGNIDLIDGANISGSTTAILNINPMSLADTAYNYNVIVFGACALSDTSINVSLAPDSVVITNEPSNQTACIGNNVSFTVTNTGLSTTYQWRKGNVNLIDGGNILGSNTVTLSINNVSLSDTAYNYNVIVSGTCAANDTSINVSLTIDSALIIATQPSNQTVCFGNTATFNINATGSGLTYQWRKGNIDLVNGLNISGANNDTLTISNVSFSDTAYNYNVVITGACSSNDTSINVSLFVDSALLITSQPNNQTVCIGNTANFNINVTGSGVTYQWRKGNVDLINLGNISGVNSSTLTITNVNFTDTAYNYNVVLTGPCSTNDTSINVSLAIDSAIIILSQPSDQTLCAGNVASFTISAAGAGITYQWRKGNVNLTNSGNITGVNTATLVISNINFLDSAYNYNVIITGTCSPNDTSINVSLIVDSAVVIVTPPANQNVCAGSNVNFSTTATGSGITYQWRRGNVNLLNFGNYSGTSTNTLSITNVGAADTAYNYNVIITGTCSANDTSINVSLIIDSAVIVVTPPANQNVCAGSNVNFSIIATGSGITYQWRKGNVNLLNFGNYSGVNTNTLSINNVGVADTAYNYNVIISGTCSTNDTSINVSLQINTAPIITSTASNQTVCVGSTINLNVVATGSGITYQWRRGNVNLLNFGNYSGTSTNTLSITNVGAADTAYNYNVIVFGTCSPNDTSLNISVQIAAPPVITTEPTNKIVCEGSSVIFSVTATGQGLTYQWRKGNVNISGATSATYTINAVTLADTAYNYNVIITGSCTPSDTSVNVSLTVIPRPIATVNSNSPICMGNTLNLTSDTIAGATYAWSGPNGYTSSTADTSIANASLTHAGTYTLVITNNGCSSTANIIVIVNNCGNADLSVVKTVNDSTPFIGTTVTFTIVATNNGTNNATGVEVTDILQSGYTYVSYTSTTGIYDESTGVWLIGNLSNGSSATLTITATVMSTGNYVNTAIIYGNEPDNNMANNTSTIETHPTDFFIPEGFSPNGDGINDLFVIRGILHYPNNSFTIFNRWGNKVYETNSYKNTWDGKSTVGLRVGGDELPVGTYFYILDLGNGSKVYKGTIYLNK